MRSSSQPPARALALGLLAATLLLCAAPARAQLAFDLSVDSDYRFRGVTLSGGEPTATLSVSYDHPRGAYAGLSAIGGDRPDDGFDLLGHVGYAGYARRVGAVVLDVGATNSKFTRARPVEYSDFYVGGLGKNVAFHLHYSPNYFDLGEDALYSDLNAWFSPAPDWRISGHAGWLSYLDDGPLPLRDRTDFRLTLARAFDSSEVRIGVTTGEPALPRQEQTTLVLGATYFF